MTSPELGTRVMTGRSGKEECSREETWMDEEQACCSKVDPRGIKEEESGAQR